jgi:hypothetical protein
MTEQRRISRVRVIKSFDLPPGWTRDVGEIMIMTLKTAQKLGDKVVILETCDAPTRYRS